MIHDYPAGLSLRLQLACVLGVAIALSSLSGLACAAVTATGDVSPSPPVSGDPLQIGSSGVGTFTIDGGTTFDSGYVTLGDFFGGFGKATVTGSGSHWTTDRLAVGQNGLGRLEIRDGGIVEVTDGYEIRIGDSSGGNGTVVVEGEGSLLHASGQLTINSSNGTGVLQIGTGAIVNVPNQNTRVNYGGRLNLQGGYLRTGSLENQGLISGRGEINSHSSGFQDNSGRIEVGVGDHLLVTLPNGPQFNNHGEVVIRGGELELSSRVNIDSQSGTRGSITLQDGVFRAGLIGTNQFDPQLNNRGLIAAIKGENHIYGKVRNESEGDITVTNESLLMFHHRVESSFNSTISVFAGSTAIFLDDLDMNGGTLLADLSGAAGYGHVEVVGAANLNGSLSINLSNSYVPAAGDSFEILTASGGVGGSMQVTPEIDLPEGLEWELEFEPNRLLLNVVDPLEGDYNLDGSVDSADYTLWRDTLGSQLVLAADGDGDKMVDDDDYDVWKTNFGAKQGSGSRSMQSIPEPATILMLALGSVCFSTRAMRRFF